MSDTEIHQVDPAGSVEAGKRGRRAAIRRDTVWVGCKLPHGLQIHEEVQVSRTDPNGKEIKVWEPTDQRVTLAGANADRKRTDPNDMSAYGITEVDSEFFGRWMESHKASDAVRNGLIFAADNERDAEVEARDRANVQTGVEGLDPENPEARVGPENYEDRPGGAAA